MPEPKDPEKLTRAVVDACADCDVCRDLMDVNCLMFPELYRLWDRETDGGASITAIDLRRLVDLCNFCALCPCPNIRSDLMTAKSAFIQRDGLGRRVRIVEDVALVSRICGTFPQLTNRLFRLQTIRSCGNRMMGLHSERFLPTFPAENFPSWAKSHNLHHKPRKGPRKVAYFAGCTANYLFPEVAEAVVLLLQSNGIEVWVPPQNCCGMPTFLEGDQRLTRKFIRSVIPILLEAVKDGFEIVCSCPTCGFFLKCLIKEGAYYSDEYQASVHADRNVLLVPDETATPADGGKRSFLHLSRMIYGKILVDKGDFSFIPPMQRIQVAEHTRDLGEYLSGLYRAGEIDLPESGTKERLIYFPPCHQREQQIGRPYLELLENVPGLSIQPLTGTLYCCGMAGIMGFKQDFHEASLKIGRPLMEKIEKSKADRIVTDCLSCRLQFNQTLSLPVSHPVEILNP